MTHGKEEPGSFTLTCISDVHVSNALPLARPEGADGVTDRLRHQLEMLDEVARVGDVHGACATIVAGDYFDKPLLDGPTLHGGVTGLQALARSGPVFVGPGNHESMTPRGAKFCTSFLRDAELPGVRWIGNDESLDDGGAAFGTDVFPSWFRAWWVDYCPAAEARLRIDRIRERIAIGAEGCVNALFMHHSINGCRDGGWVCEGHLDGDEVCEGFDFVFSGHFHRAQNFGPKLPGSSTRRGMYFGSPTPISFRDATEHNLATGTVEPAARGWWTVTFRHDKSISFDWHPTTMPRFFEQVVTIDSADDIAMFRARALALASLTSSGSNYRRLKVRCTDEMWSAFRGDADALAKDWASVDGVLFSEAVHEKVVKARAARLGDVRGVEPEELLRRWMTHALPERELVPGADEDQLLGVGVALLTGGDS